MKGFMSQLTSGPVGKNLTEGLAQGLAKAQGLAQGLTQGLPKNPPVGGTTPGDPGESAQGRNTVSAQSSSVDAQLQLQAPYSTDEETTVLREQVVQLQVKNGLLQAELEDARNYAEEAAKLRGIISDLEVKLLYALKGTDGMQPLLPKVLQEQQKRIDDLTASLAERSGLAEGLRADNARLRCQVEDLMNKMASSARHAESTHNEQLRDLQAQLAAAREESQLLRGGASSQGGDGVDSDAAVVRGQLQHARDVIKELEQEVSELQAAAARPAGRGGGSGSAEALEWRIAELEELLEEANDKLQDAERKSGSGASARATGVSDAAALEAEVQKLRSEVEAERRRVADVAAAAAVEAAMKREAELEQLRKRVASLEKDERRIAAERDAAEKRAGEVGAQLEAMRAERQQEAAAAAIAAAAAAVESTAAASAMETSVAELQSQLDAATARAAALGRELEASTGQCMTLQQQLADAVAQSATAKLAVERERASASAARAEAMEARARTEALSAQLNEAQRAAAGAEQRAGELAADLVVTRRKLETATERIVMYTEREHEAEQIVASYRAAEERYAEAQEQNELLRDALAAARAVAAAARDEAERNQEQAQLSTEAMAKLRTRMDKMNDRRAALEAQVQELQRQLDASQGELEAARSGNATRPAVAGSVAAPGEDGPALGAHPVASAEDSVAGAGFEPLGGSTAASSQTDVPVAASVSTDTIGLPRADMPNAATDTSGLPRPEMPNAATDTSGLPRPEMPNAATDTSGLPRPEMPNAATDTSGLPRPEMPNAATDTSGLPRPEMPNAATDTSGLPRQEMPNAATDTSGLPRQEMPAASTDTEGLLRPLMPTSSTDTSELSRSDMLTAATDTADTYAPQWAQPAGVVSADAAAHGDCDAGGDSACGLDSKSAGAGARARPAASTGEEAEQQERLVLELMEQLETMQAKMAALLQQLQEREEELAVLRVVAGADSTSTAAVAQPSWQALSQTAGVAAPRDSTVGAPDVPVAQAAAAASSGGGATDAAETPAAAASQGGGWDQEEWDAWDGDEASPRPTAAADATTAVGISRKSTESSDKDAPAAAAAGGDAPEGASREAEARLAAYASELSQLQHTIQQLLSCWSGEAVASSITDAVANGLAQGSGDRHDGAQVASGIYGGAGGGSAPEEEAVLGGTVMVLLGQLQAHFMEAAAMRLQLEAAGEELRRLRADSTGRGRTSGSGGSENGEVEQRMAELQDEMANMMQDMAAADQRAQVAEAAAAAAASWRQQLEQQLQRSDEAAAAAEAHAHQLAKELDEALAEAKAAMERAADAIHELECCRSELGNARDALAAVEAAEAARVAEVEAALTEARAATLAAEARANEAESRLAEVEKSAPTGTAPGAGKAGTMDGTPVSFATAAAPSPVSPEHLGLMRQIAAAAQTFGPLFHSVKASRGSVEELSNQVLELEDFASKLDAALAVYGEAAGAAAIVLDAAPPSYEQSFNSMNIGPAGATLRAAASKAEAADGVGGGTASDEAPGGLTRNLSAGRRFSDEASLRQRLEAAEAAVRAVESEMRVQANLAESLRAELQEQRAANEALRAATMDKEDVEAMEASYKQQLEHLGELLGKAADKQARQFAAFEKEHSQALAEAAKAAELRASEAEAAMEAARRAAAEAEERVVAAQAAAAEAARRADDITQGWEMRVERLQKINKKRTAELDEARAESAGLSGQVASLGEQVTTLQAELLEAKRQLDIERSAALELRATMALLQQAGDSAGHEVSELRSRAATAEAKVADLEQRAATAEAKLVASEADRSKLADQLVLLHSLREERAAALAALADAREGLAAMDALRVRCEAAETGRDRAAVELVRVNAMMGNLEARLQQVEDENEGLVVELDEERRRGAALARTWAGELEALPTLPRDRWPAAVRRLVDGLESRAGAAVEREGSGRVSEPSGHGHAEDATAAELEALREAARAAAERTARVEAEAAAANAALDQLKRQMDEARARAEAEARGEAARRLEALDALRTQLSERGGALEEELRTTKDQLRATEEGTAHLQEELNRLRDKSRTMLEEKDAEADALRAQLRQARAAAAMVAGTGASAFQLKAGGGGGGGSSVSLSGAARAAVDSEVAALPTSGALVQPGLSTSGALGPLGSLQGQDISDTLVLALRSQIVALQHELEEYKYAYEDAESTHQLRDTAQAALREELARLQAQVQLSSQDVQYLRAAIISFFESGSLPREGPVMQVLSRLLRFTPAEKAAISAAEHAHRGGRRGPAGGGAALAPLAVAPLHPGGAAAAGGGSGAGALPGLLASVTSKVASAVSGLAQHPHTGSGGPPPTGLMQSFSFGQRNTS